MLGRIVGPSNLRNCFDRIVTQEHQTTPDSGGVHRGRQIIVMLKMILDERSRFAPDHRSEPIQEIQRTNNGESSMPLRCRIVACRIVALLALMAPLFAAPAGAQAPERRFALVIGNSEYKAGRQPTAANDAGLVAETLRTAGFDVSGARDLDQETLRRSLREFVDKVSAAGPQAVSFIYLAGYGLQFEGENYIVPIDATLAREEDIPLEAIRISDLTRPLSGTPGGVKLVVIDAARPLPYKPAGPPPASGLALVEPDPGLLIAFNTAPGSVAPVEDGPYGAFAQALAEMIATGGLGLDDVFARLRLRVNATTHGVAVPWYASKVTQAFLFTERTPDAPPPPQQVVASMELQSRPIQQFNGEQEAYSAALERDTISGYKEFIAAYPDSPQVPRLRALIAVRREAIFWRRAVSTNTQEAYWTYLERYPQGAHVADAERRLSRLAAAYDPPPAFVAMSFADVDPPPADEVVYLTQPVITFNDPVFVPPPPPPDYFCPPPPPEFVVLPPPPPPIGEFFLPAPALPFIDGPQAWIRPPAFVVAPPRPPIQQITINSTTIVNERVGGGVGLMSPTLPGTVVTRVNSGLLKAPPPAPPVPALPAGNASLHPGVGVLGTRTAMPPRVHALAAPGGAASSQPRLTSPGNPRVPGSPAVPQHQPAPSTAATTPATPHAPPVVMPGQRRSHEQQGRLPATATPAPAGPGPGISPRAPAAPQINRPAPALANRQPPPVPPKPAASSPPAAIHAARPPQISQPAPPPPQAARSLPPPPAARPSPPPQVSRPTPPPPPVAHMAAPPRPAPPPQAARKCTVENGKQVCR
jgi:uncharacterized caspase-like protein